jgi:hypothetical protein
MHKFNMVRKKPNINIFFFMTSKSWNICVCASICVFFKAVTWQMRRGNVSHIRVEKWWLKPERGWMIKCNWNRIYSTKYHNIFWCRRSRTEGKMWVYVPFDWFILFCMFSGMVLKASWWILCLIFIIFMDTSFMDLHISFFCSVSWPQQLSKFFIIELRLWMKKKGC